MSTDILFYDWLQFLSTVIKKNQSVDLRLFQIVKKDFVLWLGKLVPCERIFSKAGLAITKKRSNSSGKFEKMIFSNFNLN